MYCKKFFAKSQSNVRTSPFWYKIHIQSKLAIRNFLVALKLFLNAKSSLPLWSKWQIGHRKWFLKTVPYCQVLCKSGIIIISNRLGLRVQKIIFSQKSFWIHITIYIHLFVRSLYVSPFDTMVKAQFLKIPRSILSIP